MENKILKNSEWWNDNVFTKELDIRYKAWKNGKEKAFTLNEIDDSIEQLKQNRKIISQQITGKS